MEYSSTSRKQGQRGCCPFPLHPKSPLTQPPLRFGQILLDHSEHFLHNHHASVATLRLLFTFAPECRSASLRNRCSPSPEYPVSEEEYAQLETAAQQFICKMITLKKFDNVFEARHGLKV